MTRKFRPVPHEERESASDHAARNRAERERIEYEREDQQNAARRDQQMDAALRGMGDQYDVPCVLCGEPIGDRWGHNPEPVADYDDGRACSDCNATKVIPARLGRLMP